MTPKPATYWPRSKTIALVLAGKAPEGFAEGEYDEDGMDAEGEHWCDMDRNAVEVAWAYAMDWSATIYARPTRRGIQWAIRVTEDGTSALDPEFTKGTLPKSRFKPIFEAHGMHPMWEYREARVENEVGIGSDWYDLKL